MALRPRLATGLPLSGRVFPLYPAICTRWARRSRPSQSAEKTDVFHSGRTRAGPTRLTYLSHLDHSGPADAGEHARVHGMGGNALTLTDNLGQRWTRGSRPGPAWCRTDSFASCHEVCDEAGTGVQGDDRNPSGDRRTADAGELGRGPPRGDSALCVP